MKRYIFINNVFILLIIIPFLSFSYAYLADSPWPMFRHDPQHTGRSPYLGPEQGVLKWRHKMKSLFASICPLASSPTIDSKGNLYVGGNDSLYAISQDGHLKWSYSIFQFPNCVYCSPAIEAEDTIYIGSGLLYTFSNDGEVRWWYNPGSYILLSSPTIDENGVIYLGSMGNYLFHAVNPDGTMKWRYKADFLFQYSSPAIDIDGTIYVGSEDHHLYAFNPDGTLKWRYETGGYVRSSPAIDIDRTIYVGSDDHHLYAINPDGTLKWRYRTRGEVKSSPGIATDGIIYVGSNDNYLYALNPNGTLKWRYKTDDAVLSSPAIDGEGNIYVGSNDNYLYAFTPYGSLRWRYKTGDFIYRSSPAIGEDGTIYIASNDGYLYAIGEANGSECPLSFTLESASEIEPFRRYRDEILVSKSQGKRYIDLYYKHASEVCSLLLSHPKLASSMRKIIRQLLPIVNESLVKKKATLPKDLLKEVKSFLSDLEVYSSPSLKGDLKKIEMDISSSEFLKLIENQGIY